MLRLSALAGLVIGLLGSQPAPAQEAALYTVTYIEVGPVLTRIAATALRTYRDSARKDAVSLEVFQRIDRQNQFVVLGAWTDAKAFETHSASDNAKKLNEKLATMLASPTDTRRNSGLSVAPAKTAKDPAFVITHVDVIPPEKGQRRQCARAACRRQPPALRQSAVRCLAAGGTAQPFHGGRSLDQWRLLRCP
jgi:hypothetical protein